VNWGASTQRSLQPWPIRQVLLYRERYDQNRFALHLLFADGIVGAMQCLIRCARTGDLVLLNKLLASGGTEVDYKTPEVRLWYLVLQTRACVTCVSEKKVVCLVKLTVLGAWWKCVCCCAGRHCSVFCCPMWLLGDCPGIAGTWG